MDGRFEIISWTRSRDELTEPIVAEAQAA
jgi:hypothetical protein